MATRMLQRRGTAAEWAAANPILAAGEMGFETDTFVIKMGDGVTAWNSLGLPYVPTGGGTMTGALSLIAPTADAHAARKTDVDAVQTNLDTTKVIRARKIHTVSLYTTTLNVWENWGTALVIPDPSRESNIDAFVTAVAHDPGSEPRRVSLRLRISTDAGSTWNDGATFETGMPLINASNKRVVWSAAHGLEAVTPSGAIHIQVQAVESNTPESQFVSYHLTVMA